MLVDVRYGSNFRAVTAHRTNAFVADHGKVAVRGLNYDATTGPTFPYICYFHTLVVTHNYTS